MSFHVGQKVVLFTHDVPVSIVDQLRKAGGWSEPFSIGSVWTIRDIDERYLPFYGFVGLRFAEYIAASHRVRGMGEIEKCYPAPCFRPVITHSTETGMAILRKVADDASKRQNLIVAVD